MGIFIEEFTTGLIINEVTTLVLVVLFLMVALIYKYLKDSAPSETSRRIYRYLFLAWLFFTLTYALLFIRNLILDEAINIWINKIDTSITAIGALFLYMFLGELYGSEKPKKIITALGIFEAIVATITYMFWPGFDAKPTEFGLEVIPPKTVLLIVLALILLIIVIFLFTAAYLGIKTEKPELRKRIISVSISYTIWWIFQLIEAGGILVELLGGIGMIITRAVLSILAFVIIYVWVGKEKFLEAVRGALHLAR